MDVKYISNPPNRFFPFLPHFPEASTYPKGGKRVHRALLLLPTPGGNFPIFSPSAAGEGGFFEAPGHPCRGKKESSSLSLLSLPVQIPFLLQKNLLEA